MSILDLVVVVLYRLSTLALSLVLLAGNLAVCAGWAATPEARMACCVEGDTCPMHKNESYNFSDAQAVSQAQADACCATSEPQQSSSAPSFITVISNAVLGAGIVVPISIPSLVLSDNWRTDAPTRTPPVARHVLLSVFLV